MTPRLAARGLKRSFRLGGSAIEVTRSLPGVLALQ
jgi:hypothetical protein